MKYIIKTFNQLTQKEIHQLYKARIDVFVVEQNCPYPDVDMHDLVSTHILLLNDSEELLAYCRVLPANTTFPTPSIGRVLALQRHKGYASMVVQKAINIAINTYNADTITIEAQTYARTLYEKLGFKQTSDPFLEDGIEHIQMQYHK